MMAATPSDMYMNFLDASVTLGATSTDVVSTEIATGLSIRGGLAFLIHKIQYKMFEIGQAGVTANIPIALSTRAGEGSVPELGDQGCIDAALVDVNAGAAGAETRITPFEHGFLPPIPVASPKIVAYATCSANNATYQSGKIEIRIGFTTVKIDSKMYTELAETWGFAN